MAFKVIQGHRGRYQSKARMLFPIDIVQILHQPIHFDTKFQVEGVVPQQSFLHG